MARVLIVDDEESIRATLSEILRGDGYEVDVVEDADSAIEALHAHAFDVVISDVVLPRTDGMKLVENIRQIEPDVQVIVMTGKPTLDTAVNAVRAGAADYLMKPIARNAILRSVGHAAQVGRLAGEKRRLQDANVKYQQDLERLVEQRTEELRDTNLRLNKAIHGTIHAMCRMVECRDPYTAGHQQRVADLARAIAGAMGLDRDRIDGTYFAGVVHDVGKISIPAEILSKPGKLTNIEMDMVRMHSQVGADILKGTEFPWPVANIVLQHHERIDGSGYPQGLSGDEITIEARILAVSDVVEAMAAHRPYRPALGIEKALDEVVSQKGRTLDHDAVDHCVQLFNEGQFSFE